MKTFIFIALMSLGLNAKAEALYYPFPDDATGIEAISGKVTSVTAANVPWPCAPGMVCPAVMVDVTYVEILFRLGGCMDTLGSVQWDFDAQSQTLYVSAQRVATKASTYTMCIVEPTQKEVIQIRANVPNLKVKFLTGSPQVEHFP